LTFFALFSDQAKEAREAGIHIFAIGIALRNLTELKNIATPGPGDKNVLTISEFEGLKSLKGRIFASICTGKCQLLYVILYI